MPSSNWQETLHMYNMLLQRNPLKALKSQDEIHLLTIKSSSNPIVTIRKNKIVYVVNDFISKKLSTGII